MKRVNNFEIVKAASGCCLAFARSFVHDSLLLVIKVLFINKRVICFLV